MGYSSGGGRGEGACNNLREWFGSRTAQLQLSNEKMFLNLSMEFISWKKVIFYVDKTQIYLIRIESLVFWVFVP